MLLAQIHGQLLSNVSNSQLSCYCRRCLALTSLPKVLRQLLTAISSITRCTFTGPSQKPCSSRCWQPDIPLNHVVLCRCKNVNDEGFAGLASLTGLTALDVSECATLSDVGLGALVDKLVGLQELNLQGCIHITDAGECSVKKGS